MTSKRTVKHEVEEKRGRRRVPADFYAIELAEGARYLRHIANVSNDGLLMQSPLADERPGQKIELELPQRKSDQPLRVKGEVVYVMRDGRVGIHVSNPPLPVEALGGRESL
ncbi:MAG TPA: PilZ domain-containing protein [Polyangia bacterium]|nr:PilZ domain-containing protein [Polyangia bacterium]